MATVYKFCCIFHLLLTGLWAHGVDDPIIRNCRHTHACVSTGRQLWGQVGLCLNSLGGRGSAWGGSWRTGRGGQRFILHTAVFTYTLLKGRRTLILLNRRFFWDRAGFFTLRVWFRFRRNSGGQLHFDNNSYIVLIEKFFGTLVQVLHLLFSAVWCIVLLRNLFSTQFSLQTDPAKHPGISFNLTVIPNHGPLSRCTFYFPFLSYTSA